MAYLGKTPSQAVRSRYYFTATGGETSLSGADDNSNTLTFTDGNYVDVMLNGATLVAGTDYNTTTANTIAGLAALAASDVVEIVVYDTFSVFGGNMAADLNFKDNVKANFGTGNDLQIYHNGSHSYLEDQGTGNLYIKATNLRLNNSANVSYLSADSGGAVSIYHNGSQKLATTSTGIDVTGTVTADAITLPNDGTIDFGATTCRITGEASATDTMTFKVNGGNRLLLDGGGDISFYDGAGTTQGLRWDASTQRLGLGTTSPAAPVDIAITSNQGLLIDATAGNNAYLTITNGGSNTGAKIGFDNGANATVIGHHTVGNILYANSSGKVGIGTSSPSTDAKLTIDSGTDNGALFLNSTDGDVALSLADNAGHVRLLQAGGALAFRVGGDANTMFTGDSEAARIDSSGNLLVGKTSTAVNTQGIQLASNGRFYVTSDGAESAVFNRKTSDGTIIDLRKNNTTVGSIGVTDGDNLVISSTASAHGGLKFNNTAMAAYVDGANSDGTMDLGVNVVRFKDLYLSGGVYLGGTGSANKLEDYEEGTWTPAIYYQNANDQTNSSNVSQSGVYTKVGNLVTATCYLKWSATDTRANDNIGVTGFPFAPTTSAPDSETRWMGTVRLSGTSYPQGDSQVMAVMYGGGTLATFITANNSSNLGDDLGQNTNMIAQFTITYHTNS
jgi:hypothetical protein